MNLNRLVGCVEEFDDSAVGNGSDPLSDDQDHNLYRYIVLGLISSEQGMFILVV